MIEYDKNETRRDMRERIGTYIMTALAGVGMFATAVAVMVFIEYFGVMK